MTADQHPELSHLISELNSLLRPVVDQASADIARAVGDMNVRIAVSGALGHLLDAQPDAALKLLRTIPDDKVAGVTDALTAATAHLTERLPRSTPAEEAAFAARYPRLRASALFGEVYDRRYGRADDLIDALDPADLDAVQRAASDLLSAISARLVGERGWARDRAARTAPYCGDCPPGSPWLFWSFAGGWTHNDAGDADHTPRPVWPQVQP